jgi:carboxypeptidase D
MSKYRVKNIPRLSPKDQAKIDSYAGLLPIQNGVEYFFWLFKTPTNDTSKIMIWLNGGPGCSSMDGLFVGIDWDNGREWSFSISKW